MMDRSRDQRWYVTFHWTLAALIIAMLAIGFLWLRPMPNSDPHKLGVLALHIAVGLIVAVLLGVRLRLSFKLAAPTSRRAKLVHRGLYVLIGFILATGLATAIMARVPLILLRGSGNDLPARFTSMPTFVAHTLFAELLVLLLILHVASAIYHQFILKDGLLSSMSYPSRKAGRAPPEG